MPRGFYSIMAAQFFSALADNALLIVAMGILRQLEAPPEYEPLLKLFFTLSYVLLAAFVLFAMGTAVQAFRRNYSLIPCIGMLSCAYLMIEIPAKSWEVFFGWMALGLAVYFAYGRRNSRLAQGS